jgi:hypothetical protein
MLVDPQRRAGRKPRSCDFRVGTACLCASARRDLHNHIAASVNIADPSASLILSTTAFQCNSGANLGALGDPEIESQSTSERLVATTVSSAVSFAET